MHDHEIAAIISEESGKPLIECLDEIEWVASIFEYYSEIGRDQRGRVVAPVTPRSMSMVVKESYGVVGCILELSVTFNGLKAAPALAAGNTVVVKPSKLRLFPLCTITVVGWHGKIGAALVEHPDTRVIAFTGSVDTGKKIADGSCTIKKD